MKYYLFGEDGRARLGSYPTAAAARAELPFQTLACAVITARDLQRIVDGTVKMPGQIEAEMLKRLECAA